MKNNNSDFISLTAAVRRAKSEGLNLSYEVYLHPKANQMIEAFDKANQLVKDEVLALPEE